MLAIIGTLPPPVHGMSLVTRSVLDRIRDKGASVLVINTSATSLRRSFWGRISRLPRCLWGLIRIAVSRPNAIYIGASGGKGQLYDIIFIIFARLKRVPLFVHHHNFNYIDDYFFITHVLTKVSGRKARHIVQSVRMGELLADRYRMKNEMIALSNIGLLCDIPARMQRSHVRTIGFISNISREKGIFIYLDLMDALKNSGIDVQGRIAGPFQDEDTEKGVRARLHDLPSVEYVGAKYGEDKNDFYRSIDVFVFPTMSEAEGIVNHEAMSFSIPVIAFGRGCIPEIVFGSGGLVVSPSDDFVNQSIEKIVEWVLDASYYRRCSTAAREQFERLLYESQGDWEKLTRKLLGMS